MIHSHTGKFVATALASTLLGGAAAGSAAADRPVAAAKTGTTISIQKEEAAFSGFVRSSRSSCHSGRKVTLYRKSGGKVRKVGSDTAQPNQDGSQWKVDVTRSGKHYAVVSATKKCKGATSRTLGITL